MHVYGDTLYWLPIVTQRIQYKTVWMTFSCVHSTSHAYFHRVCHPVASVKSRGVLMSSDYRKLIEPLTNCWEQFASCIPMTLVIVSSFVN